MSKFITGQNVRQIMPAPVEGTVVGFGFDATTGVISYLLEWTDADGQPQAGYFAEDWIEEC